jgi:hypothetical protein
MSLWRCVAGIRHWYGFKGCYVLYIQITRVTHSMATPTSFSCLYVGSFTCTVFRHTWSCKSTLFSIGKTHWNFIPAGRSDRHSYLRRMKVWLNIHTKEACIESKVKRGCSETVRSPESGGHFQALIRMRTDSLKLQAWEIITVKLESHNFLTSLWTSLSTPSGPLVQEFVKEYSK